MVGEVEDQGPHQACLRHSTRRRRRRLQAVGQQQQQARTMLGCHLESQIPSSAKMPVHRCRPEHGQLRAREHRPPH